MTKATLIALIILLIFTGFIIAPFLLPSDDTNAAYYEGGESDGYESDGYDGSSHHITKSARSSGGSRSFRSGK